MQSSQIDPASFGVNVGGNPAGGASQAGRRRGGGGGGGSSGSGFAAGTGRGGSIGGGRSVPQTVDMDIDPMQPIFVQMQHQHLPPKHVHSDGSLDAAFVKHPKTQHGLQGAAIHAQQLHPQLYPPQQQQLAYQAQTVFAQQPQQFQQFQQQPPPASLQYQQSAQFLHPQFAQPQFGHLQFAPPQVTQPAVAPAPAAGPRVTPAAAPFPPAQAHAPPAGCRTSSTTLRCWRARARMGEGRAIGTRIGLRMQMTGTVQPRTRYTWAKETSESKERETERQRDRERLEDRKTDRR